MVHEEHMENLRDIVRDLVGLDEVDNAVSLLTNRHPADQADLIERLDEAVRQRLISALSAEQLAGILEYLDEDVRARLLAGLPVSALAPVLNRVAEDVAADIVQELPQEQADQVVPLLRARVAVQELLNYPEDSAGGRMSREFVALRLDWTVEEALQFLRRQRPDVAQPFYLYVIADDGGLLGVVALRSLVTAPTEFPIAEIMTDGIVSVEASADQEAAAELMRHYNLLALPVVDEAGRLCGVISADDILDVQVEEATEDMFRMAGIPAEERLFRPVRESVPPRLGWLMINLCTAFLATMTVNSFEGTIGRVAALAVFMPMVAGMGGNAGIQTITLVVRSLALGEVTPADAMRALKHEFVVGLIKGAAIGLVVALIAWVWKGSAWLGLIVGFALLANIVNATLIGVLVPMALKRLKADPALAAGIFVTMLSDAVGLLCLLGLGTLLISHLT